MSEPNTDQLKVSFKCGKCGGTVLSVEDEANEQSIVTCKDCGFAFGTLGEVKAKAREKASEHITNLAKDIFRKAGFKPK